MKGNYYLVPHSIEHTPSWEANRFSASQEIPRALNGTRRFITVFTSACHLSVHYHSVTQLVTSVQINNEDIHKFSTNILEWL